MDTFPNTLGNEHGVCTASLNDSAWVHEIFSGDSNLGDKAYFRHWSG